MYLDLYSVPVFQKYVFYVFSQIKKHDFLHFFEMTYQNVVKESLASPQFVKMSSYTSLSDHCNSIPSSRSVIDSEPLLKFWLIGSISQSKLQTHSLACDTIRTFFNVF